MGKIGISTIFPIKYYFFDIQNNPLSGSSIMPETSLKREISPVLTSIEKSVYLFLPTS